MKLERVLAPAKLYSFADHSLPSGLVVGNSQDGYGRCYYIYQRGHKPWLGRGDPIAEIGSQSIRLFHTNYFSDMEDLARAYESATGFEVTIQYFQSPKDKPLEAKVE